MVYVVYVCGVCKCVCVLPWIRWSAPLSMAGHVCQRKLISLLISFGSCPPLRITPAASTIWPNEELVHWCLGRLAESGEGRTVIRWIKIFNQGSPGGLGADPLLLFLFGFLPIIREGDSQQWSVQIHTCRTSKSYFPPRLR